MEYRATVSSIRFTVCFVLLFGCAADDGQDGTSCSTEAVESGYAINCPDSESIFVSDGVDGADGADGVDGMDGADGTNGTDGSNGADGADGTNGMDGADGLNGADGMNGTDGADGADGSDGTNGMDGTDGMNGTDGVDGADGSGCTVEAAACVATMTCGDGSSVSWDLPGCLCDNCGVCDTDLTNNDTTCAQDCDGVWGGAANEDACGTCDDDPTNDCVLTDQPIAPPAGTDTTPEEGDFDWSTVNGQRIGSSFPRTNMTYPASYPKYGVASILPYSDSDECDCTACSGDTCSPTTCTYDLNANHTLTKYHVELRALADNQYTVTFEVNISAAPAINYVDLEGVLERLERTPVEYWAGYKIITEFGRGIQFLHGSYFNGAAAYGSMNYIDTQTADIGVILHELGHTFEQYTRRGGEPYQPPQAEILNPIWRNAIRADDIRTSWYGNSNEWEDMAEFAMFYAKSLIEGSLTELKLESPERYRIWERIILNGQTIVP